MKNELTRDICAKLDDLQLPYTLLDGGHIHVRTEFFDVGYGMEPKKIIYELAVTFDEPAGAVYLYVKTTEQSLLTQSGASTGTPHGSMFRTVKRLDQNGNMATVDLGAAPNFVKNTALAHGWKFRTALNLNKPHHPPKKVVVEKAVALSLPEDESVLQDMPITPRKKRRAGWRATVSLFIKQLFHRSK
ncbi:hypothetical protein AAFA46_05050 [Oscillospiraceae bacterium WX1]